MRQTCLQQVRVQARAGIAGRRGAGTGASALAPEDCGSGGRAAAFLARSSSKGEGRVRGAAGCAAAGGCGAGRGGRPPGVSPAPASASSIGTSLPRLHHAQQPQFQMEARLQGELQIAEQIERKLQVAGQILFGKLRGDLRQPLPLARRTPRSGGCRRPRFCATSRLRK